MFWCGRQPNEAEEQNIGRRMQDDDDGNKKEKRGGFMSLRNP
jgi:hypothetical protein